MAANWVGPGRGRKSTRPGANGVVELSPFEFLVPPPRKHRHRYHGVFAPNHKLRRAVTAHLTNRLGKLMARLWEEFLLECPKVRRRHPAYRHAFAAVQPASRSRFTSNRRFASRRRLGITSYA